MRRLAHVVLLATLLGARVGTPHAAPPRTQRVSTALPVPTSAVRVLIEQAEQLRLTLRLAQAHDRIDEALALAESSGDRAGQAAALRQKGLIFSAAAREREALPWLQRALAASEQIGDRAGTVLALSSLAFAMMAVGDAAQANQLAARAVDMASAGGDPLDRGRALLVWAALSEASPGLLATLDEALQIGRRLGDDGLVGEALSLRGAREFQDGNLSAAQVTLEQAVVVWQRHRDVPKAAAALLMLGRVHRAHNDYPGALAHYQRAIDLLTPTDERHTLVEAVNASAVALGAMGRHGEAIAAYQRGLALARASGNPELIDFMLGNLGGGLLTSGKHVEAIPVLEEVLARKPDPYIAAFRHNQLAVALSAVGRDAEAIDHADEAIRITRERRQVDLLDARLETRASILLKLGRTGEALTDLAESRALIETVRTKLVPTDFLRRGYADRVQRTFAMSIEALAREDRMHDALGISEQARARAFLDLLATRRNARTQAAPLDAAGIADVAARLQSSVLSYWVGTRETVIWLSRAGEAPRAVRVPVTRARLTELVAATSAPLRTEAASSRVGQAALTAADRRPWRELSRLLLDPVRPFLPAAGARLTVIPHGPLFLLSFAALELRPGRYMLEDYELHFAPSVSTLDAIGRRPGTGAPGGSGAAPGERPWLLVGNPAVLPVVAGKPLAPLPGASREVGAIAALAPGRRAIRLEGASADERVLAETLARGSPAVVHFATHGIVSDDPSQVPFLAMNRTGADGPADGRLTVDEIYDLRLDTDLVVLGACRSGAGQVSSDGVLGLARAFFYAGTASLVGTYWDVSDDVTSDLMTRFYRRYAQAGEKGAALRHAQLTVLADLRAGRLTALASGRRVALTEHPLLWSAFYLSGLPR